MESGAPADFQKTHTRIESIREAELPEMHRSSPCATAMQGKLDLHKSFVFAPVRRRNANKNMSTPTIHVHHQKIRVYVFVFKHIGFVPTTNVVHKHAHYTGHYIFIPPHPVMMVEIVHTLGVPPPKPPKAHASSVPHYCNTFVGRRPNMLKGIQNPSESSYTPFVLHLYECGFGFQGKMHFIYVVAVVLGVRF